MKIFIIEDDLSVISILEDIVERNGLGTVCGDSGEDGVDLDRIMALNPDLILVDLLMPDKDGIQVVRELKERSCPAKFIMISQVSSKEIIAKAYLAGIDFFINKPINLIEVRQVIGNLAKQHSKQFEMSFPDRSPKLSLPPRRIMSFSAAAFSTSSASWAWREKRAPRISLICACT